MKMPPKDRTARLDLIEIGPSTVGGAAALLRYVDRDEDDDWMFPPGRLVGDDDEGDDDGKRYLKAVMRRVAETLDEKLALSAGA